LPASKRMPLPFANSVHDVDKGCEPVQGFHPQR
jgi:hypothetical protein